VAALGKKGGRVKEKCAAHLGNAALSGIQDREEFSESMFTETQLGSQ
jgi:hypothetical protein